MKGIRSDYLSNGGPHSLLRVDTAVWIDPKRMTDVLTDDLSPNGRPVHRARAFRYMHTKTVKDPSARLIDPNAAHARAGERRRDKEGCGARGRV